MMVTDNFNDFYFKSIKGKFETFYEEYVDYLNHYFENYSSIDIIFVTEEDKKRCLNQIIDAILKQVSEISNYSLINFYQTKAKVNEKLSYTTFNSWLSDEKLKSEFKRSYPVLTVKCSDLVKFLKDKVLEIFDTICKYRSEIFQFIGLEETTDNLGITSFDISMGDFHQETFVLMVEVQGRKVFIKKRGSLGEQLFSILDKVYMDNGVSLPLAKTLFLSNDLFLQEMIYFEPLKDEEIHKFYYKFGIMSALFTILGTKDLHSENIIARKSGPTFIDLEASITSKTMSRYSLLKETSLFNCNEEKLIYAGYDLSGFTGKSNKIKSLVIVNSGTNKIDVGIVNHEEKRFNIPKNLSGDLVDPNNFKDEVIKGFQMGTKIFLNNKKAIVNEFQNLKTDLFDTRVVIRNTGFYAKFLHDLTLPVYMKSWSKYNNFLNLIINKSHYPQHILSEEMNSLKMFKIPYFRLGQMMEHKKIEEEFIDRIKSIDEKDLFRELHYLKMMLNYDSTDKSIKNNERTIENEVDKFLDLSLIDGKFINYGAIDFSIQEKIIDYRNEFYSFGPTLLFVDGVKKDRNLNRIITETIKSSSTGKFISGLTGYQSGLLLKYLFNIKECDNDYITVKEMANDNDLIDFSTYGSAILVLDLLYKETNNKKIFKDIVFLGRKYFDAYQNRELTGLFHGFSGDIVVLSVLSNYFPEADISKKIEKLIIKENTFYSMDRKNWKDTRDIGNDHYIYAISYGACGILLSRLFLSEKNLEVSRKLKKVISKDINNALSGLLRLKRNDFPDDTIINGFSGAILTIKFVLDSKIISNRDILVDMERFLSIGKSELSKGNWNLPVFRNIYNPCFFDGRIGTAFTLWLLEKPKKIVLDVFRK